MCTIFSVHGYSRDFNLGETKAVFDLFFFSRLGTVNFNIIIKSPSKERSVSLLLWLNSSGIVSLLSQNGGGIVTF